MATTMDARLADLRAKLRADGWTASSPARLDPVSEQLAREDRLTEPGNEADDE